jgi:Rrf2 family cysteine metabolism transcriptional repressor
VCGAHGGFTLTSAPERIKLLDIIRVSEGPLVLVECVDDAGVCPRSSKCAARDVWLELQSAMDAVLASKTLQDLVALQQEKEEQLVEVSISGLE